jgi:capsular polysaccharide biosynthesis protein
MGSHEIDYFQHFLDNGVPHLSLMQFASGVDPHTVTFVLERWTTNAIPHLLERYGFRAVKARGGTISAKKIVLPKIVPVIHPLFTQNFLDRLQLDHSRQDKVILVSRTYSDQTKQKRLILNQKALEARLKIMFGRHFVVFHAGAKSINESIRIFERAKMVIGSHGGAMYNALWASQNAQIVEIMPVEYSGAYPEQYALAYMPPFAHLAIYTNSMMNRQKFYRWYEVGVEINYHVKIDRFVEWLEHIC